MAKTYAQIQAQIRKLQQEADALKAKEVAGVVARIQAAIQHYGLTVQDLFGSARPTAKARIAARRTKAGKATKATKPPAPAKFQDAAGHQWSGIGKRPNWFKAALAAGQTADSLRIQPPSAG
jgi:DNA-binding protein H-NS